MSKMSFREIRYTGSVSDGPARRAEAKAQLMLLRSTYTSKDFDEVIEAIAAGMSRMIFILVVAIAYFRRILWV